MNLFAEQLVDVLHQHNLELSSLYSWRVEITPHFVDRLKKSLTNDKSATLNAKQIEFLAEKYDFTDAELRTLRAALVAEAVRRMFLDRMSVKIANQLGNIVLRLLLSENPDEVMQACDMLVTEVRGLPEPEGTAHLVDEPISGGERSIPTAVGGVADVTSGETAQSDIDLALDSAEEALHRGILWLELGRDARDRATRVGYVAQAQALLEHAQEQATLCATVAQGSDAQRELRVVITTMQSDAHMLA